MRHLGHIVGLSVALLFVAPEWVGLPQPVAWAAGGVILVAGTILAVRGAILRNLPESLEAEPLPAEEVPLAVASLVAEYEALGFATFGEPLRVRLAPEVAIVGLRHDGLHAYGTAFQAAAAAKPRTVFDFVSVFAGDVSLTTCGDRSAGVLPLAPGEFLQIFSGRSVAELAEAHREGVEYLRSHGFGEPRLSPLPLDELLRRAIRRKRDVFRRASVKNTLIALGRVLTGRSPNLRPIAEQHPAPALVAAPEDRDLLAPVTQHADGGNPFQGS